MHAASGEHDAVTGGDDFEILHTGERTRSSAGANAARRAAGALRVSMATVES